MQIDIVVPCYNSESSLGPLVDAINNVLGDTYKFTIILVNDFSKDGTWETIRDLANRLPGIIGLNLAFNSGQHNAILAGLSMSEAPYAIVMDDDLQTNPDQIPLLIEGLSDDLDVVYGVAPRMRQRKMKNMGRLVNDLTYKHLLRRPSHLTASNFYIMRGYVRDEITRSVSRHTNIQGLFLRTTARIGVVPVEHHQREYGQSNYTFKKALLLWFSVINYTQGLFSKAMLFGLFISAFGLIGLIASIVLAALGLVSWMSGFLLFLTMMSGLSVLLIALAGEYLERAFMILSGQPQYLIRDVSPNESSHLNSDKP